jgi:hypothetical protein
LLFRLFERIGFRLSKLSINFQAMSLSATGIFYDLLFLRL